MSRLAAYLGPLARVSALVEEGSYPLTQQQCADGFAIGWYPGDGEAEPIRLLSTMPIWDQDHLLKVARRQRSCAVMASVRKSSPGELPELSSCQPFQSGPYLFCHTGELHHFQEIFHRPLREGLSPARYAAIRGNGAGELLFATWLDALNERSGADAMADALEKMVAGVRQIANNRSAFASFAVVVSDGTCLVTLRTATHGVPPSLYSIASEENCPFPAKGRVIASDPLFPGSWSGLEAHSLTIFTADEPGT